MKPANAFDWWDASVEWQLIPLSLWGLSKMGIKSNIGEPISVGTVTLHSSMAFANIDRCPRHVLTCLPLNQNFSI